MLIKGSPVMMVNKGDGESGDESSLFRPKDRVIRAQFS